MPLSLGRVVHGTPRHVLEQRRTVTAICDGEINRQLTSLQGMFNLAIQS
jgi:hypothetical protein